MPGKSLTQQLPYFFDFASRFRVEKDGRQHPPRTDVRQRRLVACESRSHVLDAWEQPNLATLSARSVVLYE